MRGPGCRASCWCIRATTAARAPLHSGHCRALDQREPPFSPTWRSSRATCPAGLRRPPDLIKKLGQAAARHGRLVHDMPAVVTTLCSASMAVCARTLGVPILPSTVKHAGTCNHLVRAGSNGAPPGSPTHVACADRPSQRQRSSRPNPWSRSVQNVAEPRRWIPRSAGLLPHPGMTPTGRHRTRYESNPLSEIPITSFYIFLISEIVSVRWTTKLPAFAEVSQTRQQKLAGASAHRPKPAAASALGQERLAFLLLTRLDFRLSRYGLLVS